MENKINIAELLKDCPQGMKLDCVMYDNVSFDKISDDKKSVYPIFCYITDEKGNRSSISFTENGYESNRYGAKCVIFPKGKTTWEGFVPPYKFKDGDIACSTMGSIAILKNYHHNVDFSSYCGVFNDVFNTDILVKPMRLATEEEKQKLFKAIEGIGYKWNAETKTLEKLIKPKFKVGDRIKHKEKTRWVCTIVRVEDRYYIDGHPMCFTLPFGKQDEYELVPNKFDITTLKPFDKVLIRDNKEQKWFISFFGHYNNGLQRYKYCCVNDSRYAQCIPYEGNERLLDTTDDCSEFYKTWEE